MTDEQGAEFIKKRLESTKKQIAADEEALNVGTIRDTLAKAKETAKKIMTEAAGGSGLGLIQGGKQLVGLQSASSVVDFQPGVSSNFCGSDGRR